MPDLLTGQAVEVVWLDSGLSLSEGWESAEKHIERASLDRMTVVTTGVFMTQDDEVLIVGLSYDPTHDTYFGAQVIAKQNVLSMRRLA